MLMQIEIDFQIHQAIVNESRGFEEPPYLALRRLLKLPDDDSIAPKHAEPKSSGRPWCQYGVEIPHSSDARMSYMRGAQLIEGQFLDGKLVVNGREFSTLSDAASSLARTKKGLRTQLDGWKYWEVRLPGQDRWVHIRTLRFEARKIASERYKLKASPSAPAPR